MRIDLKLRLFLALTGVALAALAVFVVLQQLNLRDSFLGYVNHSAAERVAAARFRLEMRYVQFGSWDFLDGRPRLLMETLELAPRGDGRRPPAPPPPRGSRSPEPVVPQPAGTPNGADDGAATGLDHPSRSDPPPRDDAPAGNDERQRDRPVFDDRRPPPPGLRPPFRDGRPPRPGAGFPPRAGDDRPPRPGDGRPPRPIDGPPPRPGDGAEGPEQRPPQSPPAAPTRGAASGGGGSAGASAAAASVPGPTAAPPAAATPDVAGGIDSPRGPPEDPRPPPAGPFDLGPRLALYDAARDPVVTAAQPSAHYQEWPLHHGSEVIGYLRLFDAERIEGFDEIAFARSQFRFAIWAALAVLALAALSAIALAARLRAPIGRLAAATRSLAGGDYAVRVDAERGDELGQLGGDFNRLATALDDHRNARRQWGADIAHELRTPLAILRGEIQALQDGVRPLDRAALDSLEGESSRLGRLIEDLYQLSLSDAGALEYRFEAVDLVELLRDQVEQRRNPLALAGLALAVDLGTLERLVVRADATRLGQLVDNLLVNAERYTDAPGRIELRLLADQRHARIVVDDSPPGVPPSALPRLFERLYRVEASRNRATAGAGLGLAICRNIVLAHGGQISALNSPLGGLRVVVDLPLEKTR